MSAGNSSSSGFNYFATDALAPPKRRYSIFFANREAACEPNNFEATKNTSRPVNEPFVFWVSSKKQFIFYKCTHYKRKIQNPPNELLLHNEGIRPELIQLKGGFRDEGTVSKSNPLCSTRNIRIISGLSNKKAA